MIGQPEILSFHSLQEMVARLGAITAGGLADRPPTRFVGFEGRRLQMYSAARPSIRIGDLVVDAGSNDETEWIVRPPT